MSDNTQQPHPEFVIQKLYIKDSSFESPQSPSIFKENLQPMISLNVQTHSTLIEPHVYEVVLSTTVTATAEKDRTVFLIEVKQGGIFTIKNIPEQNMGAILGVTCPTLLFPYLRAEITHQAGQGGFPNFYLAPVNFEAIYLANLEKQKEKEGEGGVTH
jgi:preprotein translocase subunit SecB